MMWIRVRKAVDSVLEVLLVGLMAANVLNVLWQVATRFLLRSPSSFTEELARFLLIWIGLLGAAYAAGKKKHLAIDIVLGRLKGSTRTAVEIAIETAVFLFAAVVLLIGGLRLVAITLALNQTSAALRIKLGYVYLVLPLAGILIMLGSAGSVAEKVRALSGRRVPAPGREGQ